MEQHRDAPSHDTMFTCAACNRTFGSQQALAQHESSFTHKIMLEAELSRRLATLSIVRRLCQSE
jgi:hypothetical protein